MDPAVTISVSQLVKKIISICYQYILSITPLHWFHLSPSLTEKKSKGNTSVHQPPAELLAQPPAQPPAEPLAELSVQPLAKFSAQPLAEFPPKYRRL